MRYSQAHAGLRYVAATRNDMEQIGRAIRELRERHSTTQATLAAALDVDESTISKIETGKRGLAAAELALLARHFDVTTDEILFPEEATVLLRGTTGRDAERVKQRVEEAFADFRYVRSLVES